MELALFQHFEYLFLILVFLIPVLKLIICCKAAGGKFKLPPSPPRLPIIGNLHQIGSHPHLSLKALSEKYGPLMLLNLGQTSTLVVSSAELLKDIVKTSDIIFSDRPKHIAADILLYGCKDVVFSPYGEHWKKARKICILGLLSIKRVQQFHFVKEEEVTLLVNNINKACVCNSSVNISYMLFSIITNIISRCVLGRKCKEGDGSRKFGELPRRLEEQLVAICWGDFFSSLKWIDVIRGFIGEMHANFEAFDDYFEKVIEEHKSIRTDGHESDQNAKDFVDVLLQFQKDDKFDFEFTNVNMKAILLDMFVGGIDTTLTVLEWIMAELMRNPRVMKKAQEEVRRVVKKKQKIDMNDINRMGYLKCVIKENLRLHPPGPLLIPRETSRSTEIGGYHIPAKTRVIVNAWVIQRDPKLWEKPEEFVPERFENSTIDFKGKDFQFIPFGFGRRACPGLTFGVDSVGYVIANLLYWFDWKLPGDTNLGDDDQVKQEMDMSEVFGITLHKKFPLHLVPSPCSGESLVCTSLTI